MSCYNQRSVGSLSGLACHVNPLTVSELLKLLVLLYKLRELITHFLLTGMHCLSLTIQVYTTVTIG